jgi:hypothetical protein
MLFAPWSARASGYDMKIVPVDRPAGFPAKIEGKPVCGPAKAPCWKLFGFHVNDDGYMDVLARKLEHAGAPFTAYAAFVARPPHDYTLLKSGLDPLGGELSCAASPCNTMEVERTGAGHKFIMLGIPPEPKATIDIKGAAPADVEAIRTLVKGVVTDILEGQSEWLPTTCADARTIMASTGHTTNRPATASDTTCQDLFGGTWKDVRTGSHLVGTARDEKKVIVLAIRAASFGPVPSSGECPADYTTVASGVTVDVFANGKRIALDLGNIYLPPPLCDPAAPPWERLVVRAFPTDPFPRA